MPTRLLAVQPYSACELAHDSLSVAKASEIKATFNVRGMQRYFRTQFPRPENMPVNPSEGLTVHYVRII